MSDSEDSIELNSLVVDKCLRCNGDGSSMKLLVCSVIGCPIALHEDCMCSKPEIDEKGNFYCPYCAHKRALVRAEKLRRKALGAKEVLSMFIRRGEGNSERNEDNAGDGMDEENGGKSPGGEGMQALEVPESGDFQRGSPVLRKRRYKKRAQKTVQILHAIPLRMVSSCQTDVVDEENATKQSEEDTISSSSESGKGSELDKNEKGTASSKSSDIPDLNLNEKAATSSKSGKRPESNQSEKVTTSCFELRKAPESNRNEKTTASLSSESREILEPSQNEKATAVLPKSRKVPDSNQNEKTTSSTEPINVPESGSEELYFHNIKRRKINWTDDELNMIKEGVRHYSEKVNKNLPWRKILDRGRHVFHETRTPSNLKDKWQLMCKEATNKKTNLITWTPSKGAKHRYHVMEL